jgi:hypothetical protein
VACMTTEAFTRVDVSVTVEVLAPAEVGANLTVIVQGPVPASELILTPVQPLVTRDHSVVSVKATELVPVAQLLVPLSLTMNWQMLELPTAVAVQVSGDTGLVVMAPHPAACAVPTAPRLASVRRLKSRDERIEALTRREAPRSGCASAFKG